jgi:hypothetical protein
LRDIGEVEKVSVRIQELKASLTNESFSDVAAFLGDSNFPDYTIRPHSTVGEQIHLFTGLFQQYSTLEFSHPEDRPIAIDGLMDRLTLAFKTQSLAGIFKTFWGRCLLWQRAKGVSPLKRIPLGTHTKKTPPSWSWMAFEGPISFIGTKGGEVTWNEPPGVILPFEKRTQSSWLKTSHHGESNAIRAPAFDFAIAKDSAKGEAYVSYDCDQTFRNTETKCVVIGSDKQQVFNRETRKYYVLFISRSVQIGDAMVYERVGVGYLLGKFIEFGNQVSILLE